MYKHSNMCYFYNKNDEKDFINKIIISENDKNNRTKIITAIKYAKQFTLFSHYKNLVKLIR